MLFFLSPSGVVLIRSPLSNPFSEPAHYHVLVAGFLRFVQKWQEVGRRDERKGETAVDVGVSAVGLEDMKTHDITLKSPDFRNAQGSINAQAIKGTVCHVNLDSQI